jgi:hypothetical protein
LTDERAEYYFKGAGTCPKEESDGGDHDELPSPEPGDFGRDRVYFRAADRSRRHVLALAQGIERIRSSARREIDANEVSTVSCRESPLQKLAAEFARERTMGKARAANFFTIFEEHTEKYLHN